MKVLFAVSNENISESIVKKYQKDYKEIITYKNVYYFNAILKELQKDKSYDRIVISEDLEPFANNNYDTIDKFIFERLDSISDEATDLKGEDIPIILICTDRRSKSEQMLIKFFGLGIYSALLGQDRSIEEVCRLINKPRTKKEAKLYYKIESDDVNYQSESESDVSEVEIQNILNHYKKLGKNEERYVDSFNNIAAQYTDAQLRIIVKFLPLNVKAVLESESKKYQEVMTFGNGLSTSGSSYKPNKDYKSKSEKKQSYVQKDSMKINIIEQQLNKPKMTKPVIIPSTINPQNVTKIQDEVEQKEEVEQQKRRGRPKKVVDEAQNTQIQDQTKKKRGRPKKIQIQEVEQEEEIDLFNLTNQDSNIEQEKQGILPDVHDEEPEQDVLPGIYDEEPKQNIPEQLPQSKNQNNNNIASLISQDKKVVAFVGTTKNGTSFLVNNLGELLSSMGIKTAILDTTQNRNSYYIYTNNDEVLRKKAFECMSNLRMGRAEGININKNLTIYTSLPGENSELEDYQNLLSTLIKNYSLVLIDCDFNTNYEYFNQAQEIYLVQSMDVLTIQPLTAFLRELKSRDMLPQEKVKVVINKEQKLKSINSKMLIGGMAFYNDPAMTFMTELFNQDAVDYSFIPFDNQVYASYLDGLVNCEISLDGYSKTFINSLKELANKVYPLLATRQSYKTAKTVVNNYNSSFSTNMNNTLNKMKNNY